MEMERVRTEKLLSRAISILKEACIDGRDWSMGGGTILMLSYNHRLSKDVDVFVKSFQVTKYQPTLKTVFGHQILVDDDIEIVVKKVFFRGASLHPRDLYDLATVFVGPRSKDLVYALAEIPEQVHEFEEALYRVGPGFSFSEDYGIDLLLDVPTEIEKREVEVCKLLCKAVN